LIIQFQGATLTIIYQKCLNNIRNKSRSTVFKVFYIFLIIYPFSSTLLTRNKNVNSCKAVTLIVPLIPYIAYNAANKTAFSSFSCSMLNVGCPLNILIHGFVDEEYKEVYDLFVDNFKTGRDIGASITAYVDGHQILSPRGGW
jgi:hypothetical protein